MKNFFIVIFLIGLSFTKLFAQSRLIKYYYPNGKLKSEITYSDSIRDGEAKFYYEDGNLKEERNYINGKVDGTVKLYHKNGKIAEIFTITNGKREGAVSLFDTNGVYLRDIDFTEGKLNVPEGESESPGEPDSSLHSTIVDLKQNNTQPTPPLEHIDTQSINDAAYLINVDAKPKPVGGMAIIYKKLVYPTEARKNKIQGVVEILAFIDNTGNVDSTKVIKGLGYGCDEAAQTAVKDTKFDPALIKGEPVKSQLKISVEFRSYNN